MSIPALGGGANQAIQRALRDAERAMADELGQTDGDGTEASTARAAAGGAPGSTVRAGRRRAADAPARPGLRGQDEAVLLEIGERSQPEDLKAVGGWITTKRTLETKTAPGAQRFDDDDVKDIEDLTNLKDADAPTDAADEGAPAAEAPARGVSAPAREEHQSIDQHQSIDRRATLDRMIVVLKKTGIDFRDAHQVLREINNGVKLPPRAELQARWALADPDAWEARARTEQRDAPPSPAGDADADPRAQVEPARAAARTTDTDLRRTAVDDLIRDRDWHRAHPAESGSAGRAGGGLAVREDDDRPTLQSVVRHDASNQSYVAGLSTAEFQRLVTVLGRSAPEWFWDLRGHRGLRGLAERPSVAKLNTTRIAGTRLSAWIAAVAGSGALWYVGVHTGQWW